MPHLQIGLAALLLLACTQPALAQQDSTAAQQRSFFAIPIVYLTPETSWAFGAAAVYTFRPDGPRDTLRPSQIQLGVAYTLREQLLLYVPFQLFFKQERYSLFGEAGYYRYSYFYYGIGNRFADYDGELYGVDFPRIRVNALYKFAPAQYAGLRYWYEDFQLTEVVEGGLLADAATPGTQKSITSMLGAVYIYDDRDNVFYTRQGRYAELAVAANTRRLGGNFEHQKLSMDLRRFWPLGQRSVLALNVYAELTYGEAAFNQLSQLGGPKRMRGYYEGRFRDMHLAIVQGEYRFPLFWRLGGAVFGSCGLVGSPAAEVQAEHLRYTVGAGLRVQLLKKENLNLRIDAGVGKNTSGIYVTVGEAF